MGQLEQEKINLEHKIQIKEFQSPPEKESNSIMGKVLNNTPYQRTYASVIAKTGQESKKKQRRRDRKLDNTKNVKEA